MEENWLLRKRKFLEEVSKLMPQVDASGLCNFWIVEQVRILWAEIIAEKNKFPYFRCTLSANWSVKIISHLSPTYRPPLVRTLSICLNVSKLLKKNISPPSFLDDEMAISTLCNLICGNANVTYWFPQRKPSTFLWWTRFFNLKITSLSKHGTAGQEIIFTLTECTLY